jgi:general stress protein YciG
MTEKREMGFATMTVARQREISSMGGKACPASARSFSNREKASEAGKKGAASRIAKMWAAKKHLLEKNND